MAFEFAKAVLEQARTPVQRVKAVRVAKSLGMPLHQIEEFIDWLDLIRGSREGTDAPPNVPTGTVRK